jgi:hypothetical protein
MEQHLSSWIKAWVWHGDALSAQTYHDICWCLPAAGSVSESCRYLCALCCLDLRQYTEAESLLIGHGQAQVRYHQSSCSFTVSWQQLLQGCTTLC